MVSLGKHKQENRLLSEYDVKKLMVYDLDGQRLEDASTDLLDGDERTAAEEAVGSSPEENFLLADTVVMARKGMNILMAGTKKAAFAYRRNSSLPVILVRCSCDDYTLAPCSYVKGVLKEAAGS